MTASQGCWEGEGAARWTPPHSPWGGAGPAGGAWQQAQLWGPGTLPPPQVHPEWVSPALNIPLVEKALNWLN